MEIFAVTTPGLEDVVAAEVTALADLPVRVEIGGATIDGDLVDAAGLVLWARTPAAIRVRAGRVPARSLQELEVGARRIDWKPFLVPGQRVEVKAVLHKARFRRADAAASRACRGIEMALRQARRSHKRPPPAQTIHLRVVGNEAFFSLDAGGPLHRRGYRQATAKAPLRENLAASVLLAAEWEPGEPLADPFCGAGTFSIEAAWMAMDRAPGKDLEPSLVDWPAMPGGAWAQMVRDASKGCGSLMSPIAASDRDPGAVRATTDNLRRASVKGIGVTHTAVESAPLDAFAGQQGLVVANLPYGKRVGDDKRLHGLYRTMGRHIRERYPGWRIALLAPDKALAGRILSGISERANFRNGGIRVGLYVGEIS